MKIKALVITMLFALVPFINNAQAVKIDLDGLGGAGTVIEFDVLDWIPSASLIDDGIPVTQAGSDFTIYTHAELGSFLDAGAIVGMPPGYQLGTDFEITVVLGFGETATEVAPGIATIQFDGTNPVNFFEIYIDTATNADGNMDDDGSAGTGFNDGVMIVSGVIDSSDGVFSTYGGPVLLDQHNADALNGQVTIEGGGNVKVTATTTATNINRDYFVDVPLNFYFDLSDTTNNSLPFEQADPANNFWNGTSYISGIAGVDGTYDIDLGTINGVTGPDMLLQTDASTRVSVVPEPGTLILLGLGIVGFAGLGRRKSLKRA